MGGEYIVKYIGKKCGHCYGKGKIYRGYLRIVCPVCKGKGGPHRWPCFSSWSW